MQYVTECNGRKSLHIHALTYGSLLPEFVARVAHDPSLRHALLAALDTQVTGQLPTEYHMLNACRKVLRVGAGYDASFPPFLTAHSHSTDAPIKIEHVRQCGRAVAIDSEARGILERVEHREELLVFEQAYGPDGLFC
eukprot:COSAG01_NODE_30564_length_613_cov_3.690661_1_plen_137_part_01